MSEWESDPNVYYDPNTNSWVSTASSQPYNPGLVNPPTTPYVAPGPVPTWAGNFEASAQPPTFDPNYDPWANQAPTPQNPISPPIFAGSAGLQVPPGTPPGNTFPASSYNPTFTQGSAQMTPGPNPMSAAWAADQEYLNAKQAEIEANKALLQKKTSLEGPAKENVYQKTEADIAANRSYLNEQLRASQAKQAELMAINAAKNDVGNILSVGKAQRQRDTMAYRYNLAGLPTPLEIKLPPDYTGPMPAGTVARLMTLQDILTEQHTDNEKMRQFAVEAARIHAANTGLDVSVAQIQSGRVALTLDEAEAAATLAGLNVAQSQLNKQKAGQPPSPGLEWDETTNMWTDKNTAAVHNAQLKQQTQNQLLGVWGSMDLSTATSLYSQQPPKITEAEYRQVLSLKGFTDPNVQEVYIRIADATRATRSTSSSSGRDYEQLAADEENQ